MIKYIKGGLRFIRGLGYVIFYILAGLAKRKSNVWAFGNQKNSYGGNSKAFFEYINEFHPETNAVWITGSKRTQKLIESEGYKVYLRYSLEGIKNTLRSKVIFFNVNFSDVSTLFSGFNSLKINLWHGNGIKKVGHSDKGFSSPIFLYRNVLEYVFKFISYLDCYIRPDYLISTTEHLSKFYVEAFQISINKCLNFGTPRTDIFFKSKDEILNIKNSAPYKYFNQYIDRQKKFSKIFIYMPTWREDGKDFFETVKIDFYRLNKTLKENNALLILKLHPYSNCNLLNMEDLLNIELYDNKIDLYPYLPFTDVLITDYSSIYYDYLLLKKQTILYLPDVESYTSNSRSFIYDFEESTTGPKSYSFEQLILLIKELITEDKQSYCNKYKIKENKLIDNFWGNYNGDASKELFDFISKRIK